MERVSLDRLGRRVHPPASNNNLEMVLAHVGKSNQHHLQKKWDKSMLVPYVSL